MRTFPVIREAALVLAHMPNLVRYGSKPFREVQQSNGELLARLRPRLRDYAAALAYLPNQVFLGNAAPEALKEADRPWYAKPVPEARRFGAFGEIMPEEEFYCLLRRADQFDLLWLREEFLRQAEPQLREHPLLAAAGAGEGAGGTKPKGRDLAAILAQIERGAAMPLEHGGEVVGCIRRAHEIDPSLWCEVLLENLATKASGALALRHLLQRLEVEPGAVSYLLSCSEEAVGDRYNRGGGNLAKAIAEEVGCVNASGSDVKAFCAGPVYALVHAAALVQAGVFENVVVVGGGSLAKLGMKCMGHLEKEMPILEDCLAAMAFWVGPDDGRSPRLRLDAVGKHNVSYGASPQGMLEALVVEPLRRHGLGLCDVDRYAVELHNPEITEPAGSGNVPRANYRMLAAIAAMRGEIERGDIDAFVARRGMVGFAPTQGHVPAAVPYVAHALPALREGRLRRAMFIAKGSLFLGRMTQLADGMSFILEAREEVA
ncbi:MAG: glycine reductase [Candidatus Tectomicrobia bacterium]|nr:glycine reductase [Candidatus Tectomicrobia bacterium]